MATERDALAFRQGHFGLLSQTGRRDDPGGKDPQPHVHQQTAVAPPAASEGTALVAPRRAQYAREQLLPVRDDDEGGQPEPRRGLDVSSSGECTGDCHQGSHADREPEAGKTTAASGRPPRKQGCGADQQKQEEQHRGKRVLEVRACRR